MYRRFPTARGGAVSLKHCAISRKVADSIPDGVIETFIDIILLAALRLGGLLSL